jgi:2-alkyl-3-oxoalkanoate reductase
VRVLIAGGTGFLGARFTELLLESGDRHKITAVRVVARDTATASHLGAAGAELMAGDASDPAFARRAVKGMDAVVHCAGRSGLGGPLRLYQSNIDITAALLDAARAADVCRFIHIGSPSAYFDDTNTLNRDENYRATWAPHGYALSKMTADCMVLAANTDDFGTISLRPRFVSGRGDSYLLTRFISLHRAGMLWRIGPGDNLVDFTAVANQANAMLLSLKASAHACGEAYNITNGEPVNLWKFLDQVMQQVGLRPIRGAVPYWVARLGGLAAEGLFVFADRPPGLNRASAAVLSHAMTLSIEKARTRLGYQARQSNGEMLAEFADWYLQRRH